MLLYVSRKHSHKNIHMYHSFIRGWSFLSGGGGEFYFPIDVDFQSINNDYPLNLCSFCIHSFINICCQRKVICQSHFLHKYKLWQTLVNKLDHTLQTVYPILWVYIIVLDIKNRGMMIKIYSKEWNVENVFILNTIEHHLHEIK